MIGISEDRLHHIIGVARECYSISKELGKSESFCIKMFTIGWNHDIGYEFVENKEEHPDMSESMLKLIGLTDKFESCSEETRYAIKYHGKIPRVKTLEWYILNKADMTIDEYGNKVTYDERLSDIRERLGEDSQSFRLSKEIINILEKMDKENIVYEK